MHRFRRKIESLIWKVGFSMCPHAKMASVFKVRIAVMLLNRLKYLNYESKVAVTLLWADAHSMRRAAVRSLRFSYRGPPAPMR